MEEGDGVKEAGTGPDKSTYKNENLGNTTDKHDYYPFINKWTEYAFLLNDHSNDVFNWIDPKKRSICLPDRIEDGKVVMGQQQLFFLAQGKYYKEDELRYKHFEMDIVGMKWNIYTSTIYYKRLQVTFTATLSRPGSDTKKVLKGKFMQRYPYDCYGNTSRSKGFFRRLESGVCQTRLHLLPAQCRARPSASLRHTNGRASASAFVANGRRPLKAGIKG